MQWSKRVGKNLVALAGSSILAIASAQAVAAGVPIEPGQWQIKTAMTMPMISGERLHELTQCISTDSIDPVEMMGNSNECEVTEQDVSGETVTWKMSCNTPDGPASGSGSFTSEGANAHGSMKIEFTVQGQTLEMNTRWEGERIGSC